MQNIPDRYQPTEELIDNGYNVLSFCHSDVTSNDDDFQNSLAGVIYKDSKREKPSAGSYYK